MLMREKFKLMPKILKRQIIVRGALGAVFLLLFIILIATTKDFVLSFPCIVLSLFLAFNSFYILRISLGNQIICISGICSVVECSLIIKRNKTATIKTERGYIKFPIRKRLKNIKIGSEINLYVNEKTPVYEKDDLKTISNYYAIEIKG